MAVVPWLERLRFTYFGNATARRDLRSQLRGNQALLLWGSYLAIMIILIAVAYGGVVQPQMLSVAEVQAHLHTFYNTLMIMLSVVICVVTPAMTAGTIVIERQRRSLDLLFSGPIEPKYLLVGKMMSSFRYTWMLLVLSIPITAVCVVMGGATWGEVLIAYILLSLAALIFTSIGLTMSCVTATAPAAVIWTYVAVAAYLIFIAGVLLSYAIPGIFSSHTSTFPWFVGIVPFAAVQGAPSVATVFGHEVPGWLLVLVYSLLVCKLMLVGAGSALSPAKSKETASLRVHGLVYIALLTFLLSYSFCSVIRGGTFVAGMGHTGDTDHQMAMILFRTMTSFIVITFPVLANIVCYGADGGFKFSNDGAFAFRNALTTRPSGGLPYLILLFASMMAGMYLAWILALASLPPLELLLGIAYVGSYTFMLWTIGRAASAYSKNLKAARLLFFGLIIAFVGIPVPVLGMIESAVRSDGNIFRLHPFYPIFVDNALVESVVYSLAFSVIGASLLRIEKNRRDLRVQRQPV